MNAAEERFWGCLEMWVSRAMQGHEEYRRLGLWCDGFIPADFHLDREQPEITGDAWICPGEDQQCWSFMLFLPAGPADRSEVAWERLVPAEEPPGWMDLDMRRRRILVRVRVGAAGEQEP